MDRDPAQGRRGAADAHHRRRSAAELRRFRARRAGRRLGRQPRCSARERWRNAFVPYIWLGAAERGLAFFAENDKGWVTEKGTSKTPTHELVREGDRLTLRVYLDQPTRHARPNRGRWCSACRPRRPSRCRADWRKSAAARAGRAGRRALGRHPVRLAGAVRRRLDHRGKDPRSAPRAAVRRGLVRATTRAGTIRRKVHNESGLDLLRNGTSPSGRTTSARPGRWPCTRRRCEPPTRARSGSCIRTNGRPATARSRATAPDGLDLRGGHRSFSDISKITFVRSYADFGTWMADQWLRRGVSLYWDNTYLYPSYNTRTTAAYRGRRRPHPARAHRSGTCASTTSASGTCSSNGAASGREPLEWTLHMTNTQLLPVHTWGTVQLDHELGSRRPFSPEWLLTETDRPPGRQPAAVAVRGVRPRQRTRPRTAQRPARTHRVGPAGRSRDPAQRPLGRNC